MWDDIEEVKERWGEDKMKWIVERGDVKNWRKMMKGCMVGM